MNLKNASKKNVFVRSGTIFEGKGTQSRALTRSSVLFPGSEVALDVRCVHQSHSIRSGADFKYGGITPLSVDAAFYTSGYRASDQHTMWNAVHNVSATMQSMTGGTRKSTRPPRPSSPGALFSSATLDRAFDNAGTAFTGSDNLKQNFDDFAKNFDAILSKARLHDNQTGLALITESGCKTIELFDVPASWEALHKDAVKRMGTELLRGPDNTSVFEYKPENAVNAVRSVLALPFKSNLIYEHKPSNGEAHVAIFGVTASRYVGEVVELDGRVIHLVILESARA